MQFNTKYDFFFFHAFVVVLTEKLTEKMLTVANVILDLLKQNRVTDFTCIRQVRLDFISLYTYLRQVRPDLVPVYADKHVKMVTTAKSVECRSCRCIFVALKVFAYCIL